MPRSLTANGPIRISKRSSGSASRCTRASTSPADFSRRAARPRDWRCWRKPCRPIRSRPPHGSAWARRGLRREQWQAAQTALERALTLHPGEAIALAELGYALSRQGQLDRAVDCYRQAIARNPHNPENYYQLSYCELRRGKTAEAIAALRTAVRVRPHFALAWRELGQVLAGRGEPVEARICLERAVALAPEDEVARKLLAAQP